MRTTGRARVIDGRGREETRLAMRLLYNGSRQWQLGGRGGGGSGEDVGMRIDWRGRLGFLVEHEA